MEVDEANKADIVLITTGNSGVGKSFVDDLLLGSDVFKHEISPTSVTTESTYKIIQIKDLNDTTKTMAVFNIPGLIEADPSNVDRNKREIEKAFSTTAKQVILYIFGNENGRIRAEDVSTFKALNKAYEFKNYSLVFLYNKKPSNANTDFEAKVVLLLHNILAIPKEQDLNVVFAPDLTGLENVHSDSAAQAFREKLVHAILIAEPTQHTKHAEIILLEDAIAQANEVIKEQQEILERNNEENQEMLEEMKVRLAEQEKKFQSRTAFIKEMVPAILNAISNVAAPIAIALVKRA